MADQSIQDVVNQAQSVGDPSPSDVPATTTDNTTAEGGVEGGVKNKDNQRSNPRTLAQTEGSDKILPSQRGDALDTEIAQKEPSLVRSNGILDTVGSPNQEQDPKHGESDAHGLGGANKGTDINGRVATPDVAEDSAIQQALADASGGSDTDASRPEVGTSGYHVQSSSVKKPTSFKAVSVTKNFLAKATGSTPIAKSAADKGQYHSVVCSF